MRVKLATYNIHAGVGADGQFKPARIVQVLQELNADIVALQEVEHHNVDGYDLLDYLAMKTGSAAIAGPTLLRDTRRYGNALLTKLPVSSNNFVDLSVPGREPRGALDVRFNWNGLRILVVATHLGLEFRERRLQVRRLLTLFDSDAIDLSILMNGSSGGVPCAGCINIFSIHRLMQHILFAGLLFLLIAFGCTQEICLSA